MKLILVLIWLLCFPSVLFSQALPKSAKDTRLRPKVILKLGNEKYEPGEKIILQLWFENPSNVTTVIDHGFIARQSTFPCAFEVTFPDGAVWSTYMGEADPHHKFMIDGPIHVGPKSKILAGSWDLSRTHLNTRHSANPVGYRPFWKIVGPGVYSIRWWDGVFQLWPPLRSDSVTLIVK